MNSKLISNEVPRFFQAIGKECSDWILNRGLEYQAAFNSGNQEIIKNRYQILLNAVLEYEKGSGIRILESPDGSYICALTALSGLCQRQAEQKRLANAPVKKVIDFTSVAQANQWMNYNRNIYVTSAQITTGTRIGMMANHSYAKSIRVYYLEYKMPTVYCYGMCEIERTQLFTSANKDKFIKEWKQLNPGYEIVHLLTKTHARGDAAGLAFGFGLNRVEHNTYYIVYRVRVQRPSQ